MQEDQKIQTLEKEMIHLKVSVDNQSKLLVEVKDILHQQNNILQNVTAIRESLNDLRDDVDELETVFETRKEVTDNNNKLFSEFVAKIKGGLAVSLFFFGIIQGAVAFVLADNYETHKNFQKELQELRVEGAILKEKIKVQNLNKTVQKAIESSLNVN
jgi:DNA repair exonuclease SbcCD ATPase subunit